MANDKDYNYRSRQVSDNGVPRQGSHASALSQNRPANTEPQRTTGSGTVRTGENRAADNKGSNNKKNYTLRRILFLLIVLALIALLVLVIVKIVKAVSTPKKPAEGPVMTDVAFEAGEYGPAAEQLLTETGRDVIARGGRIEYDTDIGQINFHVLGIYKVVLIFTDTEGTRSNHAVIIRVVDTVPPTGVAVDRYTVKGEALSVADFIAPGSVKDETDVAVSFIDPQPDYNTAGTQTVNILLRDRGGNETRLTATLIVTEE